MRRGGRVTALVATLALGWPLGGVAHAAAPLLRAGTVLVTNLNANSITLVGTGSSRATTIASGAFDGPLGVAITPDGRTALVTNSLGDTVVPVTLATGVVGTPVRVGSGPSAVAIAPDGRRAYVSNFNDNTVTPLVISGDQLVAQPPIPVGVGPWSVAVSPDGRTVLVSDSESRAVSVIDVATRRVTSIGLDARPDAIAIAPGSHHAYVVDGATLTEIRLGAGTARRGPSVAIAGGPVGVAVSPRGTVGYTVNSDGTLSAFSPGNLTVGVTTTSSAQLTQPDGLALSPDGRTAYVASGSGVVVALDLARRPITEVTAVAVGGPAYGIAVEPDEAPIAVLHVRVGGAGRTSTLSAAGSYAPNDVIRSYRWDFGDGTRVVTVSPVVHHTYARVGHYQARLVVVTADGTSTATTYTGQMVLSHGAASAGASTEVLVPSSLRLSPPSGTPGGAVSLVDPSLGRACPTAYVFFDGNLVASAPVVRGALRLSDLVVPGDARIGAHAIRLACTLRGAVVATSGFRVLAAASHLTEFSVALPSLHELGRHLPAAGGISLLLVLLGRLIAAGFPSDWVNHTYAENRDRIWGPWRRRFARHLYDPDRPRSILRRLAGGLGVFVLFVGVGAVINSFLDPSFGLNRSSLWLLLGQAAGIALTTLVSGLPVAVDAWRRRRRIHLEVLVGGLAIATVSVAVSRIIGLAPGYCYGLIAGFSMVPGVSDEERGRVHAIAETVVLVSSATAFVLSTVVFRAATQPHPAAWLLVLTPALQTTFLAGFTSLAFGMFPLPFLPGRHVAEWNRVVWYVLSGLGLVGFVGVLLSPGSGSQQELAHVGLVPLLASFGGVAAVSLALMLFFHRSRERRTALAEVETTSSHDGPVEPAVSS